MPESVAIPADHSILAMIAGSGLVVQLVLLILVGLSIMSWAIAIAKHLHFKRVVRENAEFQDIFWDTRNFARVQDAARRLVSSPLSRLFATGYGELARLIESGAKRGDLEMEGVERLMRRAELEEAIRLESGLTFLATVASAAPFIGLFGTVWGIMNAFHGLGAPGASSTLQAVAPGISEALVATAVGLAAAIPAACAYNYFAVSMKHSKEGMHRFILDFVTVARGV